MVQVSRVDEEGTCTAKIVSLSKYKYEKQKKIRKSLSNTPEQKEWWFKPNIQERDIIIKLEKIKGHVSKGGVAKIVLRHDKKALKEDIDKTFELIEKYYSQFAEPISEKLYEGKNQSILVKQKK